MYRHNGLITDLKNTDDLWSAYLSAYLGLASPRFPDKAWRTYDTADSTVIEYDVPGVKESDLEITLERNRIHVTARRSNRDGQLSTSSPSHTIGTSWQVDSMSKYFDLTDVADPDRITARLADGVLTITVPKRASAQPRKIALSK